jgi:pimeloyl-ACP methyl ester carboxylesterase
MSTVSSFDGTKIAYRPVGELNRDLVKAGRLAISVCCAIRAFSKFDEVMSKTSPTVSMDLRGSGESQRPKLLTDYSVSAYSKDISAVLSANKAESAVVIGYSHGREAVVNLAITHPAQVSAVVLIEPPFFLDPSTLLERARLAEEGKVEDALRLSIAVSNPGLTGGEVEEGVKVMLTTYGHDATALAGEWRARANYRIGASQLARISAPTLVIGGSESNIREEVARTAHSIPNASLFWLHGATHFLNEEQGRQAAEITTAFLSLAHARK